MGQSVIDTMGIRLYINDLSDPKHRLTTQVGDNAAASKLVEMALCHMLSAEIVG